MVDVGNIVNVYDELGFVHANKVSERLKNTKLQWSIFKKNTTTNGMRVQVNLPAVRESICQTFCFIDDQLKFTTTMFCLVLFFAKIKNKIDTKERERARLVGSFRENSDQKTLC